MLRWKDKVISGMDRQKLFRNSGAYLLLGLSIVAMTFFGICTPRGSSVLLSGNAAKVAGDKISAMEFQRAYRNMSERLQAQYQEGFASLRGEIPKYVMRQLVDERVLFQAAIASGIEAQEDDVVRMLRDAKAFQDENGKFNSQSFGNYLRNQSYTEATFSNEIRRSLTVQAFRSFVNSTAFVSRRAAALDYRISESKYDVDYVKVDPTMLKIDISDADVAKFLDDAGKVKVKSYYESHSAEFNSKEKMKARHILISYSGARNASGGGALRTKDEARKRADDVLKQVNAAGADFAKLAVSLTDEASGKAKGGDLGFFGREDMVKEFSDAAFGLSAGQLSGVVESPFGYHIIKAEEKQAPKTVSLEQASNQIARKLLEQEKSPAMLTQRADALLADLKAGKAIDANLKTIGAKWESTGLFSPGAQSLPGVGGGVELVEASVKLPASGSIADRVFDVRGAKVILKLKARNLPEEASMDAKKQDELVQTASNSAGFALLSSYERALRKELEDKGKIWENPEYLSIGRARGGSGSDADAGG